MRYQGSKNRLAPGILAKINPDPKRPWVEPFVGGCGMMRHVQSEVRVGADANKYMIAFWQAVQNGWLPPANVTTEIHKKAKLYPESLDPELVGWLGAGCSFGGGWFTGFVGTEPGPRNPWGNVAGSLKGLMRYKGTLNGVLFLTGDYREMDITPNSIVYCDPPYEDTHGYLGKFDSKEFWDWVMEKYRAGVEIYVSEYKAPRGFRSIYAHLRLSKAGSNKAFTPTFDHLYVPTGAAYGK